MALVEIRDLSMEFITDSGSLPVLDKVSFAIDPSQTVCLVGESGSGKSVTALSITRLIPSPPANNTNGEILVGDRDILKMSPEEITKIRGKTVAYIFQEPAVSLNPVMRAGAQVLEVLKLHRSADAKDNESTDLLKLAGIADPERCARSYPHQLSGGMQQRVMIAMAIAARPKLLVADEPTTALDVTIQAQILDLLRELKATFGMSILLITHNLGIVAGFADQVMVMYAGQIVESGTVSELLANPLHPYTRALIKSVPSLGARAERLAAIPGGMPAMGKFPPGCRFAPRCPVARKECSQAVPLLETVATGREVRCPYWNSP